MSKTAGVLLLVLGLTVGLWLGFNPKAHQATVRDWDRAKAAVAHVRLTSAVRLPAPQPPVVRTKTSSLPQVSTSAAWKEVSAAFDTLWHSVESIWLRLTASIGNTRQVRTPGGD